MNEPNTKRHSKNLRDGTTRVRARVWVCVILLFAVSLLQTFYQSDCAGVGCSIAGFSDCRQCIFDNARYAAVSFFLPFFVFET